MEPASRTRLPLGLAALMVAVAASAAPATASAQSSVVVLGIRSLEGDDEFARNLTGALRHAASQVQDWRVSDREVTLAQMALAHGCDEPDAACMTAIADSLEIDRVIYGEVRRTSTGEQYDFSLNLHLFDAETDVIERSVAETIPGIHRDIDDLREPVQGFVAALSGAPRVGSIAVRTNVPGAEIFVDDASVGVADADGRLTVPDVDPGTHDVRVVAEGHDAFRSTVVVAAYDEATFEAELLTGAETGGGGGVSGGVIAGAVLMGVGVAAAGLWIWSMSEVDGVNSDPTFASAREATPRGSHVCDVTTSPAVQDLCDTGRTHEALQFVFLGAAVASAGVGVYLLVAGLSEDGGEDAQALQLTPSFGPTHGYLGLRGSF